MTRTRLDEGAHAYWQDKLAKFFPTSKGPTTVELDMFRAGYRQALVDAAQLAASEAEDQLKWEKWYFDDGSEMVSAMHRGGYGTADILSKLILRLGEEPKT